MSGLAVRQQVDCLKLKVERQQGEIRALRRDKDELLQEIERLKKAHIDDAFAFAGWRNKRVSELLTANNREVERRRALTRALCAVVETKEKNFGEADGPAHENAVAIALEALVKDTP